MPDKEYRVRPLLESVLRAMRRGAGHDRGRAVRNVVEALVIGNAEFGADDFAWIESMGRRQACGGNHVIEAGGERFYELACKYNASAAKSYEHETRRKPFWWREGDSRFRLCVGTEVLIADPDGSMRFYRVSSFSPDQGFVNLMPTAGRHDSVRGQRPRVRMSHAEVIAETKRRDEARKPKPDDAEHGGAETSAQVQE